MGKVPAMKLDLAHPRSEIRPVRERETSGLGEDAVQVFAEGAETGV